MIRDGAHRSLPYVKAHMKNLKHSILFVRMVNAVVVLFLDRLIIRTGTLCISLTCTLRTIFNLIYLPQMRISTGKISQLCFKEQSEKRGVCRQRAQYSL